MTYTKGPSGTAAALTSETEHRLPHKIKRAGRLVKQSPGYTLIEVMMVLAIIAVLSSMSASFYYRYVERVRNNRVVIDIRNIEKEITFYREVNGSYPQSLAQIGLGDSVDRWGHPYQYLRIEDSADVRGRGRGHGNVRRDRNLNPINTDYDLYSKGKDGETAIQLNSRKGRDDIVRALNGEYVGLASDF